MTRARLGARGSRVGSTWLLGRNAGTAGSAYPTLCGSSGWLAERATVRLDVHPRAATPDHGSALPTQPQLGAKPILAQDPVRGRNTLGGASWPPATRRATVWP